MNKAERTKMMMYEDYVIPMWKYKLAVQKELATRTTELKKLENLATHFLKRWIGAFSRNIYISYSADILSYSADKLSAILQW